MAKQVFDEFVRNASLYDEISFSSFVKLFPKQYQNQTEVLRRLHHWYRDDRLNRRKRVRELINERLGPLPSREVSDQEEETLESLLEQERSLKAELEALEEQNTEKKNSLKQFNDHLSQVQHILGETLKSPMPRTTELDKLLELLDEINGEAQNGE